MECLGGVNPISWWLSTVANPWSVQQRGTEGSEVQQSTPRVRSDISGSMVGQQNVFGEQDQLGMMGDESNSRQQDCGSEVYSADVGCRGEE